tara:strand:+ start:288 stop:485 length:198 start_codon:yes stop_codon:yes gene_type:complete
MIELLLGFCIICLAFAVFKVLKLIRFLEEQEIEIFKLLIRVHLLKEECKIMNTERIKDKLNKEES